jgi:methyltransferase-like protein
VSRPRPKISAAHIKRSTLETKFHIDYDWWDNSDLDLRTYLFSRLDIGDDSPLDMGVEYVDLVDPDTAEVRQVDGFQFALQTYFSQLPDDFASQTSLVDGVFYVLLANANKPMSVRQLAERVDRDPDLILKTLSGSRIYQGIKPIFNEDG